MSGRHTRVIQKFPDWVITKYMLTTKTVFEKQHKGLWRQNSLDWLAKYRYNCTSWQRAVPFAVLAPACQSGNFWIHPQISIYMYVFVCVCVFVCMYLCMFVCIWITKDRETRQLEWEKLADSWPGVCMNQSYICILLVETPMPNFTVIYWVVSEIKYIQGCQIFNLAIRKTTFTLP